MAIPNVNEITSQLRMMSDQQLQQYAAMHKADPYILPMAVSESNARKQMRSEQQALSMGQQQPKVADADIAAMAPPPQMAQQMPAQQQLPEHQGIGALPAQNMQHMADGGIAGYAGGGMDEQLAYSNEPVMRMAGGGIAHFQQGGQSIMRNTTPYGGVMGDIPGYVASENPVMPQVGAAEDLPFIQRKTREAAEAVRDGTATPQQKALVGWANRLGFGTPDLGKAAPYKPTNPTLSPESSWPTAAAPASASAPTPAPAPDIGKKPLAPPTTRPASGPSAAPAAPASSYEDRVNKMVQGSLPKVEGIAAIAAQQKAARESMGITGEAGEAQKQAFEKEAAQAADDKKEMLWMSLIKGGLAAAGGTSQHAIKNIADGFGIGLDDAAKGMKELKQAEKERNRGLAAIEEARRAEKRGDVDKAIAAQERQQDHLDNAKLHGMQAQVTFLGNQMQTDTSMQIAKLREQGENARSGAQIASSERLAKLPPKEIQAAMMLGTGATEKERLESGLKRMQEVQAGKFNPMTSYADYLKAFAGKETLTPPLSFANYAAQFGAVLPR